MKLRRHFLPPYWNIKTCLHNVSRVFLGLTSQSVLCMMRHWRSMEIVLESLKVESVPWASAVTHKGHETPRERHQFQSRTALNDKVYRSVRVDAGTKPTSNEQNSPWHLLCTLTLHPLLHNLQWCCLCWHPQGQNVNPVHAHFVI